MGGKESTSLTVLEQVEHRIFILRGQPVILDRDLAAFYGVTTARLNQQVRRNLHRFPPDFAFLLTKEEFANLKLQIATSSSGWGGPRKLPYVFTEHGALMAASVLNTALAVAASVSVVRGFVKFRRFFLAHPDLVQQIAEIRKLLEQKVDRSEFEKVIGKLLRLLTPPPDEKKEPIGFQPSKKEK